MGCGLSSSFDELDPMPVAHLIEMDQGVSVEVKDLLVKAIEQDDLTQFAALGDENNIKNTAELSEKGILWMASHFCCRWDSVHCLQFILKEVYAESPKTYIDYVNQATEQGYTCLHLCAIWNAQKCFNLLLQFGGLLLNNKDNHKQDPYNIALQYKNKKIADTLKRFKDIGVSFLNVQHEELTAGSLLQIDMQDEINQNKKKYRNYEYKMKQNIKNQFETLFQGFNTQKDAIIKQKEQLQLQRDNLLNQQVKKREKNSENLLGDLINCYMLDDPKKADEAKKQKLNLLEEVQKQAELLKKQIQQKHKQIQRTKKKVVQNERQKIQSTIDEEKKKAEELAQSMKQKLIEKRQEQRKKLKEAAKEAREKKKEMKKILEEAAQNAEKNLKKQVKQVGTLVDSQAKQLYQNALKAGEFTDSEFPPTLASLGASNDPKFQQMKKILVWLKPRQLFKNGQYELFEGIEPSDIKQGSLGVCYYLATLAALAREPDNIRRIFKFYEKNIGYYYLKMYVNGLPKYLAIDDFIPCNKSTKAPLFAQTVGNQIWVCLLEKAWAKMIGSYYGSEGMTPDHMIQDITGSPSFGGWFKNKTKKTDEIFVHCQQNHIVVLSSGDKKIDGIVNNHAYTLLATIQNKGQRIFKIRNPWGRFQWNGKYGDNSHLWTAELKAALNFQSGDDGIFFMDQAQLLDAFCYYSISLLKPSFTYNGLQFKSRSNQNLYYTFDLPEDLEINIRITQPFMRMVDDKKYQYSPVVLELGRIQQDGSVTFLTEGSQSCFWGAKSVHAEEEVSKVYKKGKYFVRICVKWINDAKYNSAVLGAYTKIKVNFKQLPDEEGQRYWRELIKSFLKDKPTKPVPNQDIQFIMCCMRGQMICCSYLKQGEAGQKRKARWTFDPKKMQNCKTAFNSIDQKTLQYEVGVGANNANFGTLAKLVIKQGCPLGGFSIQTV